MNVIFRSNPIQMEKRKFSVKIDAPKEKIWRTLWDDPTYRDWTSAFGEGSYAVSDWKEGGKVHFLIPSGSGMYSRIERHIPNETMVFEHIGVVKEGKEMPLDDEARTWTGARESYHLRNDGGSAELVVELDLATEDDGKMFAEKFPQALKRVKELAEN